MNFKQGHLKPNHRKSTNNIFFYSILMSGKKTCFRIFVINLAIIRTISLSGLIQHWKCPKHQQEEKLSVLQNCSLHHHPLGLIRNNASVLGSNNRLMSREANIHLFHFIPPHTHTVLFPPLPERRASVLIVGTDPTKYSMFLLPLSRGNFSRIIVMGA